MNVAKYVPILKVEMLNTQINTMAMLLSEFDFLPIYRADLAGSRTLSFIGPYWKGLGRDRNVEFAL